MQCGFVPWHFAGIFDDPGEDKVLDAGTSIVDDNVAQVHHFQLVIEAVTLGRWPRTADVVQINHGMMVSAFRLQDAESFDDSRLSDADRSIEENGVDHPSRLSHRLAPGALRLRDARTGGPGAANTDESW